MPRPFQLDDLITHKTDPHGRPAGEIIGLYAKGLVRVNWLGDNSTELVHETEIKRLEVWDGI